MRTWRPLLNEALRAELDAGGLAIDFGTSDQDKYTRGGWESGWGASGRDSDGTQFATTDGRDSLLNLWVRSTPVALALRVRTAGGEKESATVALDQGRTRIVESMQVGRQWSVVRGDMKPIGNWNAALSLHSSSALDIDWLWLPTTADSDEFINLPRTLPLKLEKGSRRALAAPKARALSFYLNVPPDAKLVLDVGSDQATTFTVTAQTDSSSDKILDISPIAGSWHEHVIDLKKFAGQPIRLELATQGPPGKTGWGEPEIMIPMANKKATTASRAKNLVYVVMDTTRADAFASVNPNTDVLTPGYDALATTSATFANAYDNENWTKPSVTTMWSGLYPKTHGARQATSHVDESIRFLSQQLQDNGFLTGAFIANAVVSKTFGFDKGWSLFQNDSDSNTDGNASKLYPHAAEWMEQHKDERFFLYVQSVDPHTTYDVAKEYRESYYKGNYRGQIGDSFDREEQMLVDNGKMKVTDDDMDFIRALYKGEVTYQDHYLAELIDKITDLGLMEDTLIVITNDHGEELRDHGTMGHGWPLFEEQIRAPLLMHYPPIFAPGSSVTQVIEHVDLAPTILDSLGVAPMKSADGLSFLPFLEDGIGKRQHPFYAVAWTRKGMRSVRVGDWKLISGKSSGWMYLFNLKDDPGEQANLIKKGMVHSAGAQLAGRLCQVYLGEALASPNKSERLQRTRQAQHYNSPEISVDEKTRKELEALGYL